MTKRNVELARVVKAQQALGHLLSADQWSPDLSTFSTRSTLETQKNLADLGRRIFEEESKHNEPDDRRLYWRRLAVLAALAASNHKTATFEAASRGLADLVFDEEVDDRVLITGFDPFHLDTHIEQANPSGVVALQMANRTLTVPRGAAGKPARVQFKSAIVPVRYADFDAQLIETMLRPILPDLSMVITVSMGRDGFDLERFPGRRRSVDTLDNMNLQGGGVPVLPIVPIGAQGPEFIEYSLPAAELQMVKGKYPINDNAWVKTLESGALSPRDLSELAGLTAVEGSGGGYLSNEISWRVLNTLRQADALIPAGHIHTPKMAGFDDEAMPDIVAQCCAMIEAAALTL